MSAAIGLVALGTVVAGGCSRDPLEAVRGLHEENRYFEMLEPLEALIERRPDDPEVHYLYGLACVQTLRPSLGLFPLRRAREFPGWEIRAGTELARAGIMSGDNATAIEAASRVLEIEPENVLAMGFRAEAMAGDARYEEALVDADRARELSPQDGEIELLRLRCLIGLRKLEEAAALFAEVEGRRVSGDLELPEARYCVARAIFAAESDEMDRARQTFDECIEAHPTNSLVIEQALEFFDRTRDSARSREILEQALAEGPRAMPIRQHLAGRMREAGEVEEAERLLLEATEFDPPALSAMAWQSLASHYFAIEDFGRAADAWSHVITLSPRPDDEAFMAHAEALALAGRYGEAFEVSEQLAGAGRHLVRGRILLEQRKPREALASFELGLRERPDNPVARYYAARAAEHSGDFERAISEYRHALRADAGATDAGLRLGRLHYVEGRYQAATAALGQHLRAHPGDPDAAALLFRCQVRLGQEQSAQAFLQQLSRSQGQHGRALAEAAATLAQSQGAPAAADFLLAQTARTDFTRPSNAEALRSLVTQLAAAGRQGDGLAWARKTLERHPEAASAHASLGFALEQAGGPSEAVQASYRAALERDPDDDFALWGLGRLTADAGEVDAALQFYDRARTSADRPSRRATIALDAIRLLLREDRIPEARERLEDLVWSEPIDPTAALLLAEVLLREDPSSLAALALARRGLRFGGDTRAALLLARSLRLQGKPDRSIELLEAAVKRNDDTGSVQYELALAHEAKGDREAAQAAIQSALAHGSFPEREQASAALSRLEAE